MYKILLCCTAGMTSSMLVKSMKEAAEKQKLETIIWTTAKTAVHLSWADADCLLVTPQVASALKEITELVEDKIPVALIESEYFLTMNGEAVLEKAIALIENKV